MSDKRFGIPEASVDVISPLGSPLFMGNLVAGNSRSFQNLQNRGGMLERFVTCAGAAPWSNTAVASATWQQQIALKGAPYAARVTYFAPSTGAGLNYGYTVDTTSIGQAATYTSTCTSVANFTAVTFAGAASSTILAPTDAAYSFGATSDWCVQAPVPRTDVIGAPHLLAVRSFVANVGTLNIPHSNHSSTVFNYPYNNSKGLVRNSGFQQGAGDLTLSNGVGIIDIGVSLPMVIEVRELARLITCIGIGDSLTQGTEASLGSGMLSPGDMAVMLLNSKIPETKVGYSFMNFGWASQSFAQYMARIPSILTAFSGIDLAFVQGFSPNSAPQTQAQLDVNMNIFIEGIERLRAAGVLPIIWSGMPSATLDANKDFYRKKCNVLQKTLADTYGYMYVDIAPLVSRPGTPTIFDPQFSSDKVHFNARGQALFSQLMFNAILPLSMFT